MDIGHIQVVKTVDIGETKNHFKFRLQGADEITKKFTDSQPNGYIERVTDENGVADFMGLLMGEYDVWEVPDDAYVHFEHKLYRDYSTKWQYINGYDGIGKVYANPSDKAIHYKNNNSENDRLVGDFFDTLGKIRVNLQYKREDGVTPKEDPSYTDVAKTIVLPYRNTAKKFQIRFTKYVDVIN